MQRIIDQLSAMAQMPEMANHVEALNTLVGLSQEVLNQMATREQAMGAMQGMHEQQMAELSAQAEEAEAYWRSEIETRNEKLSGYESEIAPAREKYKTAILAANPEIPADLVTGYSIGEIDRSIEKARAIVEQIRRREAERLATEKVPIGAPARGSLDTSQMSSLEKIRAGLAR